MDQQTLARSFTLEGVGIHTGEHGCITVHPADPHTGRMFRVGETQLPALVEYVTDTTRCTTLGVAGVRVSTVEHLMSALYGCCIDNALIEVVGPEIPILDGSALPFVHAIREAGVRAQPFAARELWLDDHTRMNDGASHISAEPCDELALDVRTEFSDWPEGDVALTAVVGDSDGNFVENVAPARTFAFLREVEMLMKAGLARGGSLDNALIISPPDQFSSPLRMPAEWCAHKLLDTIGDLALLGARLHLKITVQRPGHRLTVSFAKVLRESCTSRNPHTDSRSI